MKKYILMSFFLVSCGGKYPNTTPYVIDPVLGECRLYEIVDKKNLVLKYKESFEIEHCDGFWAIPPDQMAEWRQYLLKKRDEKK